MEVARGDGCGGGVLRCLAVVAFLNEEDLLPRFLASVDHQQRKPAQLVLVDDGSDDASVGIAEAFAVDRPWVTVLRRPPRPPSRDRLRGAPELTAFKWALDQVGGDEEVIVKLDADLELAPHHFRTILDRMEQDDRVGMAGSFLHARRADGTTYREEHPVQHVRGPTRFYRRACWVDIAPIDALLGWDGADEIRARARGWTTLSVDVVDPPSYHLRPTGAHDGRLRAFARWGECAYAVGAHPLGALAAAILRMRERPHIVGGVAYLAGWATGGLRGVPRFPPDIRRANRREQVQRLRSLRRSSP